MKNILIVGGSKGIGFEIVKKLIHDHKLINISRTAPEIESENLIHHTVNVSTDELPVIEDSIDAIIYCPGSINLKPINSLKLQDFYDDFDINVIGAVKCIKHYLKSLKKGTSPSVVLFSTVAVKLGMPFHSSVAVAKAGVEALTKSLAAEFAPKIRVNCIAPSVTDTPLAAGLLRNEKAREKIAERHPLKKILQPEEIANMASFLISEESSGISGQVIAVDAGLSTLKI